MPLWSSYINYLYNGWTASVGTTDRSKHKLKVDAYTSGAYAACMSRNRDLNGNGKIDEDEIRWFLPSLNEYIRMGIGAKGISSAAQLYMGDKTSMTRDNYPSSYISDGSLYYTSSGDSKRVYWAVEKGSYNKINSFYTKDSPLPIRCIRNLPANDVNTDISSIEDVTSDATYVKHNASSGTPIVLEFRNRLVPSLYRQYVQGSLEVHNEDDDENRFYDGIFVASSFLQGTYTLGDIIGYSGTVEWKVEYDWWPYIEDKSYTNNGKMTNPCANHSEGVYKNWRVPNLVELSAMNAAGLLGHNGLDVACCTQFSNQGVRYGFAYSSLIYCLGNGVGDIANSFQIRCVRDVPAGFTFPTN